MKYLIGLGVLTLSVVPGFATTINFDSATGDQGTTHTYGAIVATAYGAGSPHLYGKAGGGDENGVGLTTDRSGDHEITSGEFIQLDLSGISGPVTITMGSTTNPDAYELFGSSTALNTTVANILDTCNSAHTPCETSFTITPTLRYLDITATDGNVLLGSLSYTQATPEPVSFLLAGTGLIGIFFIRRRKTGSNKFSARI